VAVLAIPMGMMLLLPAWAMVYDLVNNWWPQRDYLLIGFGSFVLLLQAWMVGEAIPLWRRLPDVIQQAKANNEYGNQDPLTANL
jgi:carbon starvation protein